MPRKLTFLFFVATSFCWFACKKVDIQFGNQYLDDNYTQVIKVDSFSAEISTVYVDSFITSSKAVGVIGAYNDPVFGNIRANTYFEVVPPAYAQTTDYIDSFRSVTFDSIALVIHPNGNYIGDTTQPVQITVDRLAEPIAPYDNTTNYIYNTRSFAVQPVPLGSKTVVVRPNTGDSIVVRLDDALGKTLLTKFQNPNDAEVRNNDAFLQYLYGFRLRTSSGNKLLFGSRDSCVLRLYYKKPDLYLLSKTLDFKLANGQHQFNQIVADRTGTVLSNLPTAKQLSSTATGNAAYTFYQAGAMIKIRFPTVREILKLPHFAKVLQAQLIVRPLSGSYGANSYVLPPQMRLTQTTMLNQFGNDLTIVNPDGTTSVQYGNLSIDALYGQNTQYTYDVSSYLRSVINDGSINQNGLLLTPPTPALETGFGRLIVGDKNNAGQKIQLSIVYAAIQ
ncbi:MAG TPA: DUF4270 family protein [Sediminibacterium sp.]|nr:DUF4270 family protein [Sediminibacterium sp.]